MPLLSYDPMEDGTTASANLWNSRISKLHDLVNGNLDAANLANGAVTTPTIANGAVTMDKLDAESISSTPGVVRIGKILIQFGKTSITNIPGVAYGEANKAIIFLEEYLAAPTVVAMPGDISNGVGEYTTVTNVSTTGFTLWAGHVRDVGGTTSMEDSSWIAIGTAKD